MFGLEKPFFLIFFVKKQKNYGVMLWKNIMKM